jgi:hypothetical protein
MITLYFLCSLVCYSFVSKSYIRELIVILYFLEETNECKYLSIIYYYILLLYIMNNKIMFHPDQ